MAKVPALDRRLSGCIRALFPAARHAAVSDGELLERYVTARDEDAFAELVHRLGPTVIGVCRRVLGPSPDADDAFQAAFLVLARKAATVRPAGRVGAWVYGVAVLAARKALTVRYRRWCREQPLDPAADYPAAERTMDPDIACVLDEELERLPERLRLAVVTCVVCERTVAQAAVELGWPVGTVASRLSRGRAALATRLARRGVAPAALLGSHALGAAAAVPPPLVSETIAAVRAGGMGSPATVLSLTSEVLKTMTMTMSKIGRVCVGLIAVVALTLPGFHLLPTTVAAPVPKASAPAAAADPLDRVTVERLWALLKVEAVQKDLGLTDEQNQKIEATRAEIAGNAQAAFQQALQQALPGGAAPPPVPGVPQVIRLNPAVLAGGDAAVEKIVKEVLKPEQHRRLKQISLQAAGPAVLLDRKVIRALGLTADQEDKIEAAIPPVRCPGGVCQVTNLLQPNGAKEESERTDKAWATTLKLLSAEQKAAWDKLIGKALPTAELHKALVVDLQALVPTPNPGGEIPAMPPGK